MHVNKLKMNIRNKIKNVFIAVALALACLPQAKAQQAYPKHETRAVWLTTLSGLDWPKKKATSIESRKKQQRELCNILDQLKRAGVNTVMFQARIRGTVAYPSKSEPWDAAFSGSFSKSPGYDPLQFAIDECHKRGMELHAWMVTIPVGKWNSAGCKALRKKNPKLLIKVGEEGFMNPEVAATGDYIARMCEEVASNYDVDGIHLDYIRYPETWKKKTSKSVGRSHITGIVKKIHLKVKANKPWIKLTCSPIGKYDDLTRFSSKGWNARTRVCQDAQAWLRDGLMDGLYPMMYFNGNNFYPFALDWKEKSYGKPVAAGLGIYFMRDKNWPLEDIKRQMEVSRKCGLGHAYFRSEFFTDNLKGLYDFAEMSFDNGLALSEPMTWQNNYAPAPPSNLTIDRFNIADHIEWDAAAQQHHNGSYLMYNIYASNTYPVNINDARNLIATRLRANSYTIKHKENAPYKHYAVTAVNRYGNESQPATTVNLTENDMPRTANTMTGNTLYMPKLPNNLDAEFVVIETAQGTITTMQPYYSRVDITNLKPGAYVVKTLGRKAVPHRIGWLKVYRKQDNKNVYRLSVEWEK